MTRPGRELRPPKRVFYAAGCGDAIGAHESWKAGIQHPTEVSITFSSQVEQYCADIGADLLIVAHNDRRETVVDGKTTIEHLPKFWREAGGARFHVREFLHSLKLLARAVRFRADAAIIDSGTPFDAWKGAFAMFGMRVVPVLHNALWPNGFKPMSPLAKLQRLADRFFWRNIPAATLGVSPVCLRQVEEVSGNRARPMRLLLAQFDADYFSRVAPAPPHSKRPFEIMFVGRVAREKGVFDILDIARMVEEKAPGRVRWTVCGTGPDAAEITRKRDELRLKNVVDLKGWTSLDALIDTFSHSHACIVPTRSGFNEGLAMTAAEAALAGRPVITSTIVPALELLEDAAVAYRADDPASCADEVLKLIDDPERYRRLVDNAKVAARPFLDRSNGLTQALKDVLGDMPRALKVEAAARERRLPGASPRAAPDGPREAKPAPALYAAGKE